MASKVMAWSRTWTLPSRGSLLTWPSAFRHQRAGERKAESGAIRLPLLVQPYVLHAAVVVERVVGDQALHVGPLREVFLSPGQHGAGHLRLEAALDLPHEREALAPVQLLRLQIDQLVRLFVAVVGVVAGGAALVVLEEVRIGVVEAARGEIGSELIVAPREGRKPRRGVHLLEGRLHSDLVQLIRHEGAHVEIDGNSASDQLHAQGLARPVARGSEETLGLRLVHGGAAIAG